MSENSNTNQRKWQKIIFILMGGALGILLLVFGDGVGKEEGIPQNDAEVALDADKYSEMLEKRVCEICEGVKGVGKVSVFVSLKGGYRTVYAMDTQSSSSGYRYEIVMSGSGSGKDAVVTAYENPEIAGVGIVCEGADDPSVRAQIISLVSAALDVSTNKIYVADGSLA